MLMPLREFITAVDSIAVQCFHKEGVLHPMWHVVTADGVHAIVPPPPTADRDFAATLLREFFRVQEIVRCVFMDEAWSAIVSTEELPEACNRPVAERPDRIEILMYAGEDAETGSLTAHRVIIRPPSGKPQLGPLEFSEGRVSGGRFVGMLPRQGRTLQ